MELCIGTGWCAQNEGHNNPQRSKLQNSPEWLENYWRPHIEAQIEPSAWVLYHSDCDIVVSQREFNADYGEQFLASSVSARSLPYRHDWAASVLHGAIYAYCNRMDYLYIEQDCMVHNLPVVLGFARNHQMCYGYGKFSMYPGWAENSLMWVRNDALQAFICRMLTSQIKDCDGKERVIETVFHNYFCNMFTPWPFGYGRIRPIDFSQQAFYAQQLTDQEIAQFMALEGLK